MRSREVERAHHQKKLPHGSRSSTHVQRDGTTLFREVRATQQSPKGGLAISHITEVKTVLKDAQAIEDAAKALGCVLEKDAKPRYYGTTWGGHEASKCDYVLKLPGKYDLGLKRSADGTYAFQCDTELLSGSFGRDDASRKFLGEDAGRFRQEYATSVAMRAAKRKTGVSVFRSTREDGAVVLTLRG